MSLLNLTSETMVTLSERWLDAKKHRKVLTALPLLAPLVPVLQKAHGDLVAKQKMGSAITAEIVTVQKQQAERDARHDRKIRGSHAVLTGFADLADDPEQARLLLDLRDRLLPIGLKATMRSYVDEAGDATRLPARLDDASKKLLARLPTPQGPLGDHVAAWTDEAREIGALEEQRDHLNHRLAAGEGGPSAAEVLQARNAWIRVVRALESNLALSPEASDETLEKLLGPLRRAELKADRRRGASGPQDDGDGNGTDEVDDTMDVPPAEGVVHGAPGGTVTSPG